MEQLRQVLTQDDTVLFIGSGISLWSGLPSWPKLIEELAVFIEREGDCADLIRNEMRRGDFLQAASYGFDKLTKHQIGEFIRSTCRYGVAKPHEVHRKIVLLGPRCFVTTNYDNLVEDSLRLWQPDRFFRPPVTNRHLTELAEIVHARAIDFVFKPHGDAADSDSIILTREQYRQLLPGGERQATLESLKMLLASRPVVYLGFGLRDPDFMYVRDLLSNTYKGGTRDHYAIIADSTSEETDYWRRNYGIHLISYPTVICPNGSRDHSAFLKLLDDLLVSPSPVTKPMLPVEEESCTPELILALARHAGRLTQFNKNEPEFPLLVLKERSQTQKSELTYLLDKFNNCPVDQFLEEIPNHALLIGLPGAGKTYSLKRSAAHLGEELNKACLSDSFDQKNVLIPIIADLKLYRGDLRDLVEQALPRGLSLLALSSCFKLKIFLDSFNEMPREHWENGTYEEDFSRFIESFNNTTLIICSRTNDGLERFDFASYCLDQIDDKFVETELQQRQYQIDGRFEREILVLLKKPFFFQLYISGSVELSPDPHPRDIFQSFFQMLTNSFESNFRISFDLERTLTIIAYNAMNCGEETQPLTQIIQVLRKQLQERGLGNIDPVEVANWMVSRSVFIPYIGGRIAFFHQSVTEFLAASELARRYQRSPQILQEKLSFIHWDQAIYLTLSLLPKETGAKFLRSVMEIDFLLALKASKYIETGRDAIVTKLLSEVLARTKSPWEYQSEMSHALRYGVPVSDIHESLLREIMACGSSIGAAAVQLLVELRGGSVKSELLKSMIDCRNDYNYCCNGIAPAISPFIEKEDLKTLVTMADSIEEEVKPGSDETIADGFICGVEKLFNSIDISAIRDVFLPCDEVEPISEVRARILCSLLRSRHSSAALELAAELLMRGVSKAATTIYFIVNFAKPENNLSLSSLNNDHVNRLLSILKNLDKNTWALRALKIICAARPDLVEAVESRTSKEHGLFKATTMYSINPNDNKPIFDALSELADMNVEQRMKEPIFLLKQIELDWKGHETLLVRLLKLRDSELAMNLIENIVMTIELDQINAIGELEIGPIEWWLDWLMEEESTESGWFLLDRISIFFERYLALETRNAFVAEFNKPASKYRRILANSILLRRDNLSTNHFSKDAISFLMASLKERISRRHLLGSTATEQFVTEHLLPQLSIAEEPFATNLRLVLQHAGSRHGRRYVAT
jgi:hypothetical protein